MTNEMTTFDPTTGEVIAAPEKVIFENSEYKVIRLEDGTFKKNMKYHELFTKQATNDAEKLELFKVFNDADSELVTPMKMMINKPITIAHIFTSPYQSFDEKTGNVLDGVTTTIQDTSGHYYATSSKTVYHKVMAIMKAFGRPGTENYKPVTVKVTGTKQVNGVQIDLVIEGI